MSCWTADRDSERSTSVRKRSRRSPAREEKEHDRDREHGNQDERKPAAWEEAERRTAVVHERQPEELSQDADRLAHEQVSRRQRLRRLIEGQYRRGAREERPEARAHRAALDAFSCFSWQFTHRLACGIASSLCFPISLPHVSQTPYSLR